MNRMRDLYPDPLVVMALDQEGGEAFRKAGIPVLFTGVGKINAAQALTWKLAEYAHAERPLPLVLNLGTAGAARLEVGGLVECNRFYQRDMDVAPLGFAPGVTPFDDSPAILEFPVVFGALPSGLCGTGDSFSTDHCGTYCDVVDMEAYALAKVCWLRGASFVSVKYVSDNANSDAAQSWQHQLEKAAEKFVSLYLQRWPEKSTR
jgi:adenosylhomocysteine nucleosidase